MGKFKVGDRVRFMESHYAGPNWKVGETGTIVGKARNSKRDWHIISTLDGYNREGLDFSEHELELAEPHSTYTITRPITIANLIAKASRCHEWNAEFVKFCEKYPEGYPDGRKPEADFLQEAPQKWIDWLYEKGFVKKVERKFKAGDRFRDDAGDEFVLASKGSGKAIRLVNVTRGVYSIWLGRMEDTEFTLGQIMSEENMPVFGTLYPIEG